MGRTPTSKDGVAADPLLFKESELPTTAVAGGKNFRSLTCPLWTENKARLIQEYIKLFTFVTKHGAYIDGFAAPQRRNHSELCSARLVLETEPKWVRELWLCDIDPKGICLLEEIKTRHAEKGRRIEVVPGDFNLTIDEILGSGRITEKTATFALLDQRMFECAWATVKKIAQHKTETKIEIFYFFATGWIDRSIAAIKTAPAAAEAERWWGHPDWRRLKGVNGIERANLLAKRFRDELGYAEARPYAVHDAHQGGRTMYHMIHATDHPEASSLMLRAYRKVAGRRDWDRPTTQADLEELWSEVAK
jgi:three-Cys-motif partner protein